MLTFKLLDRSDDINHVADTIQLAIKDSPFRNLSPNRDALLRLIGQYYAKENGGARFLLLALDEDKIVGLVGASTLTDHFLFMDHKVGQEIVWWVHPDYRGGPIAKQLIKYLEEWAEVMKLDHLFSGHYENEYSEKLKGLYTKMGYKLSEYNYWKELN